MQQSEISLIVPARNEEELLPRLLDSVLVARDQYRGGLERIEIIVSDNVSTDSTAKIAHERGCRVALVEKRCIAAVRNGGAAIAQGRVVSFVDADSVVHPDTFNAVAETMADERVVAAATGVKMERMSIGIGLTYLCFVPMLWATRMDTGVVFCRRDDFEAIGGYDEGLRFAEDVRFLWDLRRLGKPRGQKLKRIRRAKAIASTRKFDDWGDWHYFGLIPRAGLSLFRCDPKLNEFAGRYWYDR